MTDYDLELVFEMMNSRLSRGDHNRSAPCPLAPWTHKSGQDKHPSMRVKNGDRAALFRCFGCHSQGTVHHLAELYFQHSGDARPATFMSGLKTPNYWGRDYEYNANFKRIGRQINQSIAYGITEERLKGFMEKVPTYAFERNITKKQIIDWEIGFDKKECRMIFTVRDYLNKLVGVSGRDVTGQQKPKYKHYFGFKKESVLYGEKFLERGNTTAYLTEGFMDVLALERAGLKNVFGTMGTSVSDEQISRLDRWFKKVIFVPDVDDGGVGMQFAQRYGEQIALRTKIKVGLAGVQMNKKFEPRSRPKDWEECDHRFLPLPFMEGKDPADLSKGDLDEALKNVCWVDFKPQQEQTVDWL